MLFDPYLHMLIPWGKHWMWVGLVPKPNFFIYVVNFEPVPMSSPTYLVHFSSPKNPKPKVWTLSPAQATKIMPDPPLVNTCEKNWHLVSWRAQLPRYRAFESRQSLSLGEYLCVYFGYFWLYICTKLVNEIWEKGGLHSGIVSACHRGD
jgi:hypothetical protein